MRDSRPASDVSGALMPGSDGPPGCGAMTFVVNGAAGRGPIAFQLERALKPVDR